jgi:two-component system sensor histidine kinase QseC
VDLQALTQEAWHSFSARAAERRLQISLEAPPVSALADPALLRAILTNLFENAVDYTPAGGAVAICVESKPDTVTLRIRNSSDGLTAEDVTKMFDRFWRKEEARSGGNHFGLGLSLAKMFAHAMDWTLSAQLDEQRRLEFTLSGPAAKTA